MGTFDGLQVALSSLYAQRRGMDVTGQNIANANTDGYSRQRVVMQSVGGNTVPAIFSTWNGSAGGVSIAEVTRMRDTFMDIRGRAAHASLEQSTVSQQALNQLERLMNEPSDTGLASSLADMWAGFDAVANNPGDEAARSQLLQRASAVADWLNAAHSAISDQWSTGRTQLGALTAEANTAAAGIAELNAAIKTATVAGLPSNELADQRDLLAMKLAQLTGATTRVGDDGSLDVYLGGTTFVRGNVAEQLAATANPVDLNGVTATTRVGVTWAGGTPVTGLSGTANGLVTVLNDTLPHYAGQLDAVADSVSSSVNAVQIAGYDLNGSLGVALFAGTGAAGLKVALADPRLLAASRTAPVVDPITGALVPSLDGGNADAMAKLATSLTGPDATYRRVVVNLGVDAQTVNRSVAVQSSVTTDIDDARDSAAGVNIDEEMTNMLTFQRAYEAASRTLTSVDEMLDTLINHTGLVGR
jgi:flagellar hook-associated protein 1